MNHTKKVVTIFFIIAGLLVIAILSMFFITGRDVKNLVYSDAQLDEVSDGVYQGSAEVTLVKVEVEVQDHKIVGIYVLEHQNGLDSKAESATDQMVDQNTYDVDAVSGATISSEVMKSAVSNALAKGTK